MGGEVLFACPKPLRKARKPKNKRIDTPRPSSCSGGEGWTLKEWYLPSELKKDLPAAAAVVRIHSYESYFKALKAGEFSAERSGSLRSNTRSARCKYPVPVGPGSVLLAQIRPAIESILKPWIVLRLQLPREFVPVTTQHFPILRIVR